MIAGTGTDLLDVRRVQAVMKRFGDKFIARCFTASEIERSQKFTDSAARVHYFAKRFAAKEAVIKAMGAGASAGVMMRDITIANDERGKPLVQMSGSAQDFLDRKCADHNGQKAQLHLSLSDEPPYVLAFVILDIC
jgi:holo-[acyl-carrier protein] synthase